MHRSPSRTANSDRRSLKESNPILLRGREKEKPQSESWFFLGSLRSHEVATVGRTRINPELGITIQDTFDALLLRGARCVPAVRPIRFGNFCSATLLPHHADRNAKRSFGKL